MLTDKARARLAEDCGWTALTIHNPPLGPATDYRDNNGNLMIDATGQLTDAGCWQASKKLLLNPYPLAGGKIWKVALPVGFPALSLADNTPESALMLAIQEVYG